MSRRRVVTRTVEVVLEEADVRAAILTMARCPQKYRGEAGIQNLENGTIQVAWTESPKSDGTQPDADPGKRERAMRANKIDLSGKVFGDLTVVGEAPSFVYGSGGQQTAWLCLCSCGDEARYNAYRLRRGTVQRCRSCTKMLFRVPDDERICRYCGVGLAPNSKLPTRCPKHERQQLRKGLCPCGKFPFYKHRACPKCDRKRGEGEGVKVCGTANSGEGDES